MEIDKSILEGDNDKIDKELTFILAQQKKLEQKTFTTSIALEIKKNRKRITKLLNKRLKKLLNKPVELLEIGEE